jgi:hypothetical protein
MEWIEIATVWEEEEEEVEDERRVLFSFRPKESC